eukprot:727242_1
MKRFKIILPVMFVAYILLPLFFFNYYYQTFTNVSCDHELTPCELPPNKQEIISSDEFIPNDVSYTNILTWKPNPKCRKFYIALFAGKKAAHHLVNQDIWYSLQQKDIENKQKYNGSNYIAGSNLWSYPKEEETFANIIFDKFCRNNLDNSNNYVLDIGANIGYFSLIAA